MDSSVVAAAVWVVVFAVIVLVFSRVGGSRRGAGPGASGAVYDMLNEDRRKALEIIVEERAEARDPEHRDGNLPELEEPTRKQEKGR